MKNLRCVPLQIVFLVVVSWKFSMPAHAGSQLSLGIAAGTAIPNSASMHLAPGAFALLSYAPWNRLAFVLSSGYFAWGYKTSKTNNTRIIPIIVGVRSFFADEGFRPYASAEFDYILGKYDWSISQPSPPFLPGNLYSGTTDISESGLGVGLGFQLPLARSLKCDVGSSILLTSQTGETLNIRVLAGLVFEM